MIAAEISRTPRDRAEFDAEGRERSACDAEGQGEPRRQRERTARVVRAPGGGDDRDERQHARAQDRQHARGEGERQREDEIHIAALSTLTTTFLVTPQDMRATSLPPL